MSNTIVLTQTGLFAGASVDERDLFDMRDHEGQLSLRDGQVVRGVPIMALTPIFLDTFPPDEGWGVITEHQPGSYNLPDPYTIDASGCPIPQPTEWITVKLVDPKGRVVAQASSLVIINGAKAYERGETIARGRLYEALGLPRTTAPVVEDLPTRVAQSNRPVPSASPTQPAATAASLQSEVKPLSSGKRPTPPVPAAPANAPSSEDVRDREQQDSTQALPASSDAGDPPKRSTLKVIERQAKMHGMPVPPLRTEQEASAFLNQLRARGLN